MDFEQALVHELQAIVGLNGKVYPSNTEENSEPPFVVYVSSSGERVMTLGGPSNLTELTCEIHIITETYEQLRSYSKLILDRIRGFFQRVIGQSGPYIKSISHTEPVEDLEKNINFHRSSFDLRIRY